MPPTQLPAQWSRRQLLHFAAAGAGLLPALAAGAAPARAAEGENPERLAAKIAANQTIQRARRAALDVLQPKAKDLAHGIALHSQALVFDAYAFAPQAAVDGAALANAVEDGASDIELQDLSEDLMMTRWVRDPAEREEFGLAWQAAGVTCIYQNAGEEGQDPLRLLKRLARFTYVTDMARDFVGRAVTPADVVAAHQAGKRCLYLSGNGVPLTQQWVSVEDELRYVPVFFQLGIRMMHLTYQRRNLLGDGCGEPADGGTSPR